MNQAQVLSEVSEALNVAGRVSELGWNRDRTPNPQLAKLGDEVHKLADNLNKVLLIVENARLCYQQHAIRSPMFRGFYVQKEWQLSSLLEICGPFRAAIAECEALLAGNRDVYRSEASAYSDQWLVVMQPKVDDMCARLRLHNTKFELVLKPLETKLLRDIQQEFASSPATQYPRQALPPVPIHGLIVANVAQTFADYAQPQFMNFEVPPDVDQELQRQLEEAKPELKYPETIRLQSGIDIFAEYFEQSTKAFVPGNFVTERQPSALQYLNLTRASHVLQLMQQSQHLRHVDDASLWPLCLAEMIHSIRAECERFSSSSTNPLMAPDANSLKRALKGPRREGVGSREDVSKIMSPHHQTYSKPIFIVALPSPQNGVERQLAISRVDEKKLRLVESAYDENNRSEPIGEIVMDLDLNTVQLTPIYATPSSRPRPLEVLIQTQLQQLNPTFGKMKDIYRLQHLLTGYQVYQKYDQAMVKVTFVISGKKEPLEEHGRVQLWLPHPFNSTTEPTTNSPSQTSGDAPGHASTPMANIPLDAASASSSESSLKRGTSFRNWIPGMRKNNQSSHPKTASNVGKRLGSKPSTLSPNSGAPTVTASAPRDYGPFELPATDIGATPLGASQQLTSHGPSIPQHSVATQGVIRAADGVVWNGPVHLPYRPSTNQQPGAEVRPEFSRPAPLNVHNSPQAADDRPNSFSSGYNSASGGYSSSQSDHSRTNSFGDPASARSPRHEYPYSPDSFSPIPVSPWSHDSPTQFPRDDPHSPVTPSSLYTTQQYPPSTIRPGKHAKASPSMMSSRSTRSHSSVMSTVTTIRTSNSTSSVSNTGIARMHHKPQKPLLVIFLKSRDPTAKLSIVAIQIDGNTNVVRERCECFNSHSTCRISCVERDAKGGLLAQRWDADAGLTSFNVAQLGEHQRKEGQNSWPDLKRVSLKFEKWEDRYTFAGSPCSCNVQTTHELSRCNQQSHNGIFGIVKQIGESRLAKYHSERNSALSRPIELAPLVEGDFIS